MKKIPLTHNRFALIDDEDFEKVSQYKWRVIQNRYVEGRKIGNGKEYIRLHRLVMNTPKNKDTDHIDCDGFNNQKVNLRICTTSQNLMRRRKLNPEKFTSRFKGVFWNTSHGKWEAKIGFNNKKIFIGRFKEELDAVRAYNERAVELFKEFALPNLIPNF